MTFKVKPLRAILAGFIACLGMLVFMFSMPYLGGPEFNIFGLFSTLSADYTWWAEPLEYFSLGVVVFPLLYSVVVQDDIPGHYPWQRGLIWGLFLWLVRGLVVAPVMGEGVFSFHLPHFLAALWETLVAHLIYGFLLGALSASSDAPTRAPRKTPVRQVARR